MRPAPWAGCWAACSAAARDRIDVGAATPDERWSQSGPRRERRTGAKGPVMSIFGDIMGKIFHHPSAQADAGALQASAVAVANAAAAAPVAQPAAAAAPVAQPAAAPAQPVDVEAVLTKMSADEGDHLN